jgi:hypothetical protein
LAAALCVLPSWAAGVSGQGTWETTLLPRYFVGDDIDHPSAYYDTVLGITWLRNANAAGTTMDWTTANAWATALDLDGTPGADGWRLPLVVDTGTSGCNWANTGTDCGYNVDTATGEMAHMFYVTLGNLAYYNTSGAGPQPGWGLTNTGPFSSLMASNYWSGTQYAPVSGAWLFDFRYGSQNARPKYDGYYAWAVYPGPIGAAAPVPLPAAAWLLASGLVGLLGIGRRLRP